MTKLWMFTCESCGRKTASECDTIDAADVRCAMCGSALVGDKVDVVVVSSERLAALEKALKIYADESNWSHVMCGEGENEYEAFCGKDESLWGRDSDPWHFARTALAEKGSE